MSKALINAQDFATPSSTTSGIQEAINALPSAGGCVLLPPGLYPLRRSVELRSGVTLRGAGPSSILTRPREIITRVTRPTDGSRSTICVHSVLGLRVGDEVFVGDDENYGWWTTHAVITGIRKTILDLEVMHGEKKYRYLPKCHARLTNWFPALWLRERRDVSIENLAIQGIRRKPVREACDFVVAAIHSRNSENLRVMNVTVRHWLGDGIGIQGGSCAFVSGCLVEHCTGHGYHPGTGITQSTWSHNIARHNTRDGLFFCLRVTHSTVMGNVLTDNGGHGIGGLSDPDAHNVVIGNVCAGNGCHGIDADRAVSNTIQGNICRGNSRRTPGRYAGIYLGAHRDNVVTGNLCPPGEGQPGRQRGLVAKGPTGNNVLSGNLQG